MADPEETGPEPETLAATAVTADEKLAKALEKATSDLIEHRFHWTLDETNDKRVSIATYALATGNDRGVVQRYAVARGTYEVGVAADEDYTAVEALDSTWVDAARMR